MNTANHAETTPQFTAAIAMPKHKVCTSCQHEFIVSDYVHHTSFGLELCDDCLYS